MSYVIDEKCLGERYASCVAVCPVDCIYPGDYNGEEFMVIDPEVCITCGRIDGNYILQFPNLADFIISEHGALVQYLPKPDIPIETIRHLLLDQVIPRVLGQQGRLVIHASAVTLPNRKTIAFLGNSGQGKSTIASYFCIFKNNTKLPNISIRSNSSRLHI